MKKYYLVTVHYDMDVAIEICNGDKYELLDIMDNLPPVDDTEYSERALLSKKEFKKCNNGKDYIVAKIIYNEKKIIPMSKASYIQCMKEMKDLIQDEECKVSSYDYELKILSEKKLVKLLKEGYEITEA
jgi:hypothetical protein